MADQEENQLNVLKDVGAGGSSKANAASASKAARTLPQRPAPDGQERSVTDALSASSPGLDIVNEKYIDTDSRDSEEMSFEQFKKMKTQGKITPRSKGGKSQKGQGRSQQRKPAGA